MQVNVAASVEDNVDDAVIDVEHSNVEYEPESVILTEVEREEYQEMENSDTKIEEGPSPHDMEDEKSDVIDTDEDAAALVKVEEVTIEGAKSKFEDEHHLCIQAEQEGRQLNAEENEVEHKDFVTRLDNRGDGIYFRGEAKVVAEEDNE